MGAAEEKALTIVMAGEGARREEHFMDVFCFDFVLGQKALRKSRITTMNLGGVNAMNTSFMKMHPTEATGSSQKRKYLLNGLRNIR